MNTNKILFPIGSVFPSQQGGPSNSIYWICLALNKCGFYTKVISTDVLTNNLVKQNKYLDTEFGTVIYNSEINYKLPIKTIFRTILELRNFEIIHLNSIFYPLSFITFLFAKFTNKQIIWSVRGELSPKAIEFSNFHKKILIGTIKKLLNSNVTFHSTSEFETECIYNTFGKNVNIKYLPNFMLLPTKLNLKKSKIFTYVGRLHKIKGIDNLIYAFAKSKSFNSSDFQFHIAGFDNSDYSKFLQNLVCELNLSHKIIFINYITGRQKQEFLSRSYFNFLPSHSENFGLVVIEALAQGTPVVASTNTPWEILELKNAGYFSNNDIDSLICIIDELISSYDSKNYKIMCENAYNLAKSDFDVFSIENLNLIKEFYNLY